MAIDIPRDTLATLGLAIDSSGALRASSDLKQMAAAGGQAEQANKRVEQTSRSATPAISAMATQAQRAATTQQALATSASTLARTSTSGTAGLNSIRSAMTAVAASALNTAPGVAQLSGIIGSLALGSGVMIGVMAGMAALGYAWEFLTRKARETKEATEDALEALGKLGSGQTAAMGIQANIALARAEVTRLQIEGDELRNNRRRVRGPTTGIDADIAANAAAIADAQQRIQNGYQEITSIYLAEGAKLDAERLEQQRKGERDREAAQREHLARLRRDWENWHRWNSVLGNIVDQRSAGNDRSRLGLLPSPIGPGEGAMVATGGVSRGSQAFRSDTNIWQQRAGQARDMAGTALNGLAGGALRLLSAFNPLSLLASALGAALVPVGNMMAKLSGILAKALLPILEALWPVFKTIVIAGTYVGQILFKLAAVVLDISSWIWRSIGSLVKGIGDLLNKLPGSIGNPLVAAGNAMIAAGKAIGGVADGFREGADELGRARDEIKGMSWEDATKSVENFGTALNRVTTDFPKAMDLMLYEQRFATGAGRTRTATPRTPAPFGRPTDTGGTVTVNGGMHFTVVNEAGDDDEALARKMERAATTLLGRGQFLRLPGAVVTA